MSQKFAASGSELLAVLMTLAAGLIATGCGGAGSGAPSSGTAVGDTIPQGVSSASTSTGQPGGTATTSSALGARCAAGAAGTKYCIGLKYVVFQNSSGTSSADQPTVVSNIAQVNQIWASCSIAFQLEEYDSVNPTTYSLSADGDTDAEMNAMRSAFTSSTQFLDVSLWGTVAGADAWTEEAGSSAPFGTILDDNVVTYVPVIAHEMGHYLGLEHVTDQTNLMYPSPYPNSVLTSDQCATATATAQSNWPAMLR